MNQCGLHDLASRMILSLIFIVISVFVVSGLGFAQPVTLTDNLLDEVTAGTANEASSAGGVIVGNSSSASIVKNGTVTIEGEAQQSSRAINMVTSTDSLIANGFNLLSGRSESPLNLPAEGLDNSGYDGIIVNNNQNNNNNQDQLQSASVPDYVRSEANVNRTSSEVSKMEHEGNVVTVQKILGQEVRAGKGITVAGSLEAELTGGTIHFDNYLNTTFEAEANVGILGDLLTGDLSGSVSVETNQNFDWTLPDLDVDVKAAGCFVMMGSCDAKGSFESDTQTTENIRSPFSLKNAEAEYIVVDESHLSVQSTYNVNLTGSAQRDVRALNLVNASGSTVANGVNIARTPMAFNTLNLNQINTIVQRY